ncbi:MAG: hypothetical protein GXP27_16760 [Planctomycetes bacterium]|nr:hypothetical protein [Planctomycetota bacterium]
MRKIKETYPDHVAGTKPGDAAVRLKVRTEQKGDSVTHVYDLALAGRRTARVPLVWHNGRRSRR